MPLWKQRLFSRLQGPAGEGADLGGGDTQSATETAIDNVGSTTEAETAAAPAPAPAPAEEAEAGAEGKPASKMLAMLDSLSDTPAPKPADVPAAQPAAELPKEGQPAAAKPLEVAKTPEQEEAELLEGVKSERGRERIKSVFAKAKALETDIGDFRQLVTSTGMSPDQFAQSLEFGRLVNSGSEADARVALGMIEAQRTALYARLGVEAPGVDLLAGHDDLKAGVDNLEITRERALELAKFRKADGEQKQRQQVQQQTQQESQQYAQTVQQAATAMEGYLATRQNEVDHLPRMKALSAYFADPAKMQAFVKTYRPDQWAETVKMMYDNVALARPAHTAAAQPLRSRPANLGTPSPHGSTPLDRLASRMESMGL